MCNCATESGKDCVVCLVDLWNSIEKEQISCLNEEIVGSIKGIVKENRFLSISSFSSDQCKSDCDGELLVKIPFKGSVKVTKINIAICSALSYTIKAFINSPDMDFSSLSPTATQQWILDGTKEIYSLETVPYKFQNVTQITLFIKSSPVACLKHLGFEGEFKHYRHAPVITAYEVAPNAKKFEETEAAKKVHFF
jgi:hypothetical protein